MTRSLSRRFGITLAFLAFASTMAVTVKAECPTLIQEWGTPGTGEGQFNRPVGVETDADGFVYVVESYNHRLQKFSSTGEFIEMWGWGVATGAAAYERCTSGCQEGIPGTGDGQFDGPFDVAIDAAGDVYVSEYGGHRVQKFDSDGNFLLKWGSFGTGDGQFNQPNALTTNDAGDIYVSDYHNHRVQKFDSEGNFLLKWGSFGTGDGQFKSPFGIATNADGDVYVAEYDNHRVQKFDSDGNFILKWGSFGNGPGQFNSARTVAVDAAGYVYINDVFNDRYQKFDGDGNYVCQFSSLVNGGMATDDSGSFYSSGHYDHKMQKFANVTMFGGLSNYQLGGAELLAEGDSLVVSAIGMSGQDGVGIHIENFPGFDFNWGGDGCIFDLPADAGAELNMTVLVAVPEPPLARGLKDPVGGVKVSRKALADKEKVSCDFSALDVTTCRLMILDDYVVQYDAQVPTMTEVDVYPPEPGPRARMAIKESGVKVTNDEGSDGTADATFTAVRLDYTESHPMVVLGTAVTGDEIVWKRTGGVAAAEMRELRIQALAPPGSCIEEFVLKSMEPRLLGAHVEASGEGTITAIPGSPALLHVETFGEGSGDQGFRCGTNDPIKGVEVEVEKAPGGIAVPYFGATYGNLDPGGAWPVGAEMAWHADGVIDGVEGVGLGEFDCVAIQQPGVKVIEADLSDLEASEMQVEVKSGGVTLHTLITADPAVALVPLYPDAVTYDIAATAESNAGYALAWASPITITVDGEDYLADGLVIGVPAGGAPGKSAGGRSNPSGVTALPVHVKHIPAFSVTAITFPDLPTGVADNPGTSAAAGMRMTVWPSPGPGPVSFRFAAPREARLKVDIYDVSGRRVRHVADRAIAAGQNVITWDGRTDAGKAAVAGVYFVRGSFGSSGSATEEVHGRFVLIR